MKVAVFQNIWNKTFTGYWNGKGKTFQPGEKKSMPDWLAKHYAKHLTNAILMEKGGSSENATSPKKPEAVPEFFNLFNQACIIEDDGQDLDETEVEVEIANEPSMNIPGKPAKLVKPKGRPKKETKETEEVQIVTPPDKNDEEFEGLETNK